MECSLISLARFIYIILCVAVAVLRVSSETDSFEIWSNDNDTSNAFYHSLPSLSDLQNATTSESEVPSTDTNQNFTNVENTDANIKKQDIETNDESFNHHQRGAFYYASSSDARQENTSVHIFIKSDESSEKSNTKVNSAKNTNNLTTKDGKLCVGECLEKTVKYSKKDSLLNNRISKVDQKDVNKRINDRPVDMESSQKRFSVAESSNDSSCNYLNKISSETFTGGSGPIMFRSRSFNEEDDFLEMSSVESKPQPSHMKNSFERFSDSGTDSESYYPPSGIQGRRSRSDGSSENIPPPTANGINRRTGGASRVPLLPVFPIPQNNTSKENIEEKNATANQLTEIINQLRQARAAGVKFTDENSNQQDCRTPDGSAGTCTPLPECRPVMETIRSQMPVICRWIRDMPVVCCPNPTLSRKFDIPGCGTRTIRGLNRIARQVARTIPLEFGVSSDKRPSVAGGEESQLGAWPWMAGIYTRNFGIENFLCGAAIINKWHVVTAAHCFRTRGGA
ncbi:Clotting factor B like protein [Argiope bruennichi]|uniref:Clotting factor B like protein n=1 Tax=Argiope bruennichi TaxID=94029 RepID=A0A8T0FC37_ARGBR|nr:Clotting factor B like protein [Argiope bruennichi]